MFLFYHGSQEEESLSPFICEPSLSLSPSHCARMSSCILPLGKYWEIGEARSRWVEGNERTAEEGGGEIWNCCYTNRMGAADFQFGQISCAIFLNITKTNYPGPWCMFLLLWKTIKLCKWLMPFHTARFSLWISKVFFPFSLCLKQLYSKNLLDAFPVNPLSMFLYKQVFERTRGWGGDKQANSQWKAGLSWGARLVIITASRICNFV